MKQDQEIEKAKNNLRGEAIAEVDMTRETNIPHFEMDANIDGVVIFNNSEQAELIPILVVIHSIKKSAQSKDKKHILKSSTPILLGYYHGQGKPNIKKFLAPLLQDLKRLDPYNPNERERASLEFTVTLRCIRTDAPMRSYLKRVKSHSGYWSCERCIQRGVQWPLWPKASKEPVRNQPATNPAKPKKKIKKIIQLRETNAPPRVDEDFYTYCKSDTVEDEHIPNVCDVSPFSEIDFKMVSGFIIDSMHTVYGAFSRRLQGITSVKHEGKLKVELLAAVDARLRLFAKCKPLEFDRTVRQLTISVNNYKDAELRQFLYYLLYPVFHKILEKKQLENLMLLPQSMLLLGSYNPEPVPAEKSAEARRLLKLYVEQMKEFGFPIRFLTHNVIHIPEDVINHQTGVETLDAFIYENVQRVFRYILGSGNKPVEQIRNRLTERNKYLLPTSADGLILAHAEDFYAQAELMEQQEAGSKHILLEFVNKGAKYPKQLRFAKFTLSTVFPDNICLLNNGKVFVCTEISNNLRNNSLSVSGFRFQMTATAFQQPYSSLDYHIQIVSKLEEDLHEISIQQIKGKMYALPMPISSEELIRDEIPEMSCKKTKWYVSPLFHTLY